MPAGTSHKFWNAGETEAKFVCEVRPALQFERLLETMFALANDGKTSKKGMPNPLRLAVIANAHFDDVRLPFPPAWMQKAGLVMGAPIGRLSATSRATTARGRSRSRSRSSSLFVREGRGRGFKPRTCPSRTFLANEAKETR